MALNPTMVDAARAGDRGAVLALLDACQPDLRRFARRTCATTEDAEDAVQLALWQMYRRVGALRTGAALAGWLFRIVERMCIRLFRGRRATVSLDGLDEADQVASSEIPMGLRLDLARAIEGLPADHRTVLILRDVQGWTGPEVAEQLGLSLDAVKSRLHRARASMRERLMASGYWHGADPGTASFKET